MAQAQAQGKVGKHKVCVPLLIYSANTLITVYYLAQTTKTDILYPANLEIQNSKYKLDLQEIKYLEH